MPPTELARLPDRLRLRLPDLDRERDLDRAEPALRLRLRLPERLRLFERDFDLEPDLDRDLDLEPDLDLERDFDLDPDRERDRDFDREPDLALDFERLPDLDRERLFDREPDFDLDLDLDLDLATFFSPLPDRDRLDRLDPTLRLRLFLSTTGDPLRDRALFSTAASPFFTGSASGDFERRADSTLSFTPFALPLLDLDLREPAGLGLRDAAGLFERDLDRDFTEPSALGLRLPPERLPACDTDRDRERDFRGDLTPPLGLASCDAVFSSMETSATRKEEKNQKSQGRFSGFSASK